MKRRTLTLLLAGLFAAGLFADDRKKSGMSTETPPAPVSATVAPPQAVFWPPLPAPSSKPFPTVGLTSSGLYTIPPVASPCWTEANGPGTPGFMHQGIARFVIEGGVPESLPAKAEKEITTRMIILTVSDEWFEKSGLAKAIAKLPTTAGAPACVIGNLDAHELLTQARVDSGTDLFTNPTLTCLSGQPGSISMGNRQVFTTSLTAKSLNGMTVMEPKTESHDIGMSFDVVPTVSADGKSVRLVVAGKCSQHTLLPVPQSPVTTLVPAVAVGGKPSEEPVPFTQFLESPKISVRTVKVDAMVPIGRTALMYGGSDTVVQTTDTKAVKAGKRKLHLVVLATPEVVEQPKPVLSEPARIREHQQLVEVEEKRQTNEEWHRFWMNNQPSCLTYDRVDGDKLSKLMTEYRLACYAGKTDDARRLAMECLVIDPTCFSKK